MRRTRCLAISIVSASMTDAVPETTAGRPLRAGEASPSIGARKMATPRRAGAAHRIGAFQRPEAPYFEGSCPMAGTLRLKACETVDCGQFGLAPGGAFVSFAPGFQELCQ